MILPTINILDHLLVVLVRGEPQEVHYQREAAPEEDDEPIELNTHPSERPAHQHDEDATEKSPTAFGLVPLEEESKCPLMPNKAS